MSTVRQGFSDYTDTPRSDGYRGYRVALQVGDRYVQRYFAPHRQDEAVNEWDRLRVLQLQLGTRATRAGRSEHRRGSTVEADTGVCGLRLVFAIDRDGLTRPTIGLGTRIDGRIVSRSRRVSPRQSIARAWDEITRELARLQGRARRPPAWLAAVPDARQFVALAAVKRAAGVRIDEAALSALVEAEARGAKRAERETERARG